MRDMIKKVRLILGGMGVAVSDFYLVQQFLMATEKHGIFAMGTVSLTAIGEVLIRRLQLGDTRMRDAFKAFPVQEISNYVWDKYFILGGKNYLTPFRTLPKFSIRPSEELQWINILAGFVEVWMAKRGHESLVSANFLEKVQPPFIYWATGAIWAGADCFSIGAGLPFHVPSIIDQILAGGKVRQKLDVAGVSEIKYFMELDVEYLMRNMSQQSKDRVRRLRLERPAFLPIVTLGETADIVEKKTGGKTDGEIVERRKAAGHNAPPRGGRGALDEHGEPLYTSRDEINFAKIEAIGKPFWVAGGYFGPEYRREASLLGATGIQFGSPAAYCKQSALSEWIKATGRKMGYLGALEVFSDPFISPSGFPFQVANIPGTLWDAEIRASHVGICDLGYLQQPYIKSDGSLGFSCPAEGAHRKSACLCNALLSGIGLGQIRNGAVEPAVSTLGKELGYFKKLMSGDDGSFSIEDLVMYHFGLC